MPAAQQRHQLGRTRATLRSALARRLWRTLALKMNPLIKSISESEMTYIAGLDYGQDSEQHLESLRSVIFAQDGVLREGQTWFPYEVIELGANALITGHEREFSICTLLVIQAVVSGFDSSTNLEAKLSERAQDYDLLPPSLRDEVLRAYEIAEC